MYWDDGYPIKKILAKFNTSQKKPKTRVALWQGQQGIVLITSVIMLVLITLVGLLAMNNTNFELIMAGNSQYQVQALNNAEKTLIAAENFIENNVSGTGFDFSASDGYYVLDPSSTIDPMGYSWNFTKETALEQGTPVGNYIVEYAGERKLPGESWDIGNSLAGSEVFIYRISARATEARGALRLVQSIYAALESP